MATGTRFAHLFNKRILGRTALKTRFFDYLKEYTEDLGAVLYGEGVFTAVSMAGTVADKFDLTDTNGHDGLGHHIEWAGASWSFENTGAQWYDVGFFYAEKPYPDIEENPRTGEYEYIDTVETAGDIGTPDSVTYPGPGLNLVIDTILGGPGTSHAGRQATVYLKDKAASLLPATAFETVTIAYAAGSNSITTAGALGQSSPSTTASDYEVIVEGPSVRAVAAPATLKGTAGFIYLGSVQGAGAGLVPSTFDTSQQTVYDVIADAAEVLYKDAHGKVKIRVTADPFDIDEPQISVWDNALAEVLTITDLRTHASKRVEIADGASTTPELAFVPGAGAIEWQIFADDTAQVLHLGRNDATANIRKVRLSNIGGGLGVGLSVTDNIEVGDGTSGPPSPSIRFLQSGIAQPSSFYALGYTLYAHVNDVVNDWTLSVLNAGAGRLFHLNVEGDITTENGGLKSTFNALSFDDVNIGTPIPLSASGFGSLGTFHQSMLGAFYDFDQMFNETIGSGVISSTDFTIASTVGTSVNVNGGDAIVFGNRVEVPGVFNVACTPSTSGWIYLNVAGGLSYTTNPDTAMTGGLPILYVVVGAATITSYQDVRKRVANAADDMFEFSVGDVGHFPDFEVAIAYLDLLSQATLPLAGVRPRFALRQVGAVPVYTGSGIVIPVTLEDIRIEGVSGQTSRILQWSGSGPYFYLLSGHIGFTLKNATFQYSGPTPPATDAYVVNGDNLASDLQLIDFDRVTVMPGVGGTGGLFRAINTNIQFLRVKGCILYADLSLVDLAGGSCNRSVISENHILKFGAGGVASTTYNAIDCGTSCDYVWIEDNTYSNDSGFGSHVDAIKIINSRFVSIRANVFKGDPCCTGYAIDADGTNNFYIQGNLFQNDTLGVGALSGGIRVQDNGFIIENTLNAIGNALDAIVRYGISASIGSLVTANLTISGNEIIDCRGSAAYGIFVTASSSQDGIRIADNVLTSIGDLAIVGDSAASPDAICCSGNYISGFGLEVGSSAGISLGLGSDHIISDNHVISTTDAKNGIIVPDASIVEGNHVSVWEDATSSSVAIYDGGGQNGSVILGNHVSGGFDGIQIGLNSTAHVISNNRCEGQARHGISIDGPKHSIGNNVVWQPGANGIDLTGNADNCTVYGNVIDTPVGFGIDLNTGADNNEVICNQTGGGGVNDSGTGNDVAHNI